MKLLILLSLCLSLNVTNTFADGGEEGNGGDSYSIAFVKLGNLVQENLENFYPQNMPKIDLGSLKKAVTETKVESTDQELILNGVVKDAINYPIQKKIVINKGRWTEMEYSAKRSLVFHEYLGIMGEDDNNYQISSYLNSDEGMGFFPKKENGQLYLVNGGGMTATTASGYYGVIMNCTFVLGGCSYRKAVDYFSAKSDATGICKMFGFNQAVDFNKEKMINPFGIELVVNSYGDVIKTLPKATQNISHAALRQDSTRSFLYSDKKVEVYTYVRCN